MAYILGGTTLKNPVFFERELIEFAATNISISGRTTKDIFNQKERYILELRSLTPSQASAIVSIYSGKAVVDFEVTETNLTIPATEVHVEIDRRSYIKGGDYREDLLLYLTEVS